MALRLVCEYDFVEFACECMERPVCVTRLYVRTFGMRRVCEIVRCTLVWREMQACIHEGVHGQEVLLLSVQYVSISLDNCADSVCRAHKMCADSCPLPSYLPFLYMQCTVVSVSPGACGALWSSTGKPPTV